MISSHVLDTALGMPARGLAAELSLLQADGSWRAIADARTNEDGRLLDLADAAVLGGHTCRLAFDTGSYFEASGRPVFFPRVEIIFNVAHGQARYHVPLLLSPFGYSTYRGS